MHADDRLLGSIGSRSRKHGPHDSARLQAVLTHLAALLNTRAGSSLLDPTYGLPDLTHHAHATEIQADSLAQRIATCVRRHEPRLTQLAVRAEPPCEAAPQGLRFAITASLADGTPLRLMGQLDHGGRVSLRHGES